MTPVVSAVIVAATFFFLVADPATALRLRFDPDYSPPSSANAVAQPALYSAYNRPVFSRTRRAIKVRIETDGGTLITSGEDSSLVIKLTSVTGYYENQIYPGEQQTVDQLTADGKQWLFKYAGAEHVHDTVHHEIVKWSSIEVTAVGGIAVFPPLFATTPTVYISNSTTNAPYEGGLATLLDGICCKSAWKAFPANPSKGQAVYSQPYHVFQRAETLELATPLPETVATDEALPPLEVRIMSLNYQERDGNGDPIKVPLLHGGDTDIDIQLTLSWDTKLLAYSPPPANMSVEGLDVSPLFYSAVEMRGDGVTRTFRDDLAVRKRATLLDSGYYGVVFEGIHFKDVASNVRLNFTMTHIGGGDYYAKTQTASTLSAAPWSRAGLGFPDFTNMSAATLWDIRPDHDLTNEWEFRPVDGLYPSMYQGYEDNLISVGTASPTALPFNVSCSHVTDERRREWCETSGVTADITADPGPGVYISEPFAIVGRNASAIHINWARGAGDLPEISNYLLWDDLSVQLVDESDTPVIAGPDAALTVTVEAFELSGLDANHTVLGAATLCDVATSGTLALTAGAGTFAHAVCGIYEAMAIRFTAQSSVTGESFSAWTRPFPVDGYVPVAVLLPEGATESDFALDYRALPMFINHPVVGYGGRGPAAINFGHTPGHNFVTHFIDTSGSPGEVLEALNEAKRTVRMRHVLGPYRNEIADVVASWMSAQLPNQCHISFSASNAQLADSSRYPNMWRMVFSAEMYYVALTKSLIARKWTKLTIIQSREAYPVPEVFYNLLREAQIEVIADVSVPRNAHTTGASLETQLATLVNVDARIVLTTVGGGLTNYVLAAASDAGLDAKNGVQWIGTEDALEGFDPIALPDARRRFAGIAFMTPMYGLGDKAAAFQAPSTSDFLFHRNLGGLDPFWTRSADFNVRRLNMWQYSKATLALDALWFLAFSVVAAIDYGISYSPAYWSDLHSWIFNLALHSGSAMNFNSNLDRRGFTGVWAQLRDDDLEALYAASVSTGVPFEPWAITTTVDLAEASDDLVELRFRDPRTLEQSDWPQYGSNITLTPRTFRTKAALDPAEPVVETRGLTPVTHRCRGGCGGGLRNASASAYEYAHGTCSGPDRCTCVLQINTSKAAFVGSNCETVVCEHSCRNGECEYRADGTTGCNCSAGWTGDDCGTALCLRDGCVSPQGACALPDTCVCEAGWYGADCSGKCDCGLGSCSDGNAGTGSCTCDPGVFGSACQASCTCVNGDCNDGAAGTGLCNSCESGWLGSNCDIPLPAVVLPALMGVALLVYLARYYLRRARHRALLGNMEWRVDWSDVALHTHDAEVSQKLESMLFHSALSVGGGGGNGNGGAGGGAGRSAAAHERLGKYRGALVSIQRVQRPTVLLSNEIKHEVRAMREARHPNLLTFVGACLDEPNVAILYEYAQKGALEDILANPDVRLDLTMKLHLLKDVAAGMRYLHGNASLRSHGRLRTASCMVDNRWTVKISDFGLREFQSGAVLSDEEAGCDMHDTLRYTAPELLTPSTTSITDVTTGSQQGDAFSFGIIMSEVFTREQPYDDLSMSMRDIIARVRRGLVHDPKAEAMTTCSVGGGGAGVAELPSYEAAQLSMPPLVKKAWEADNLTSIEAYTEVLRPSVPADCPTAFVQLMEGCWAEDAAERPNFRDIGKALDALAPSKGSMVDNLIYMLEKYSRDLEGIVGERTKELAVEKEKVENLVCRMLPRKIVDDLKVGKSIKAESFDEVTIFFSDIVGFTRICSQSKPMQVVDMLNDLYTCFDNIVDSYDVYKVETIGDAYMVVSGLPERNGDAHAAQIASMALHLLSAMIDFRIKHLPEERLQLRIGLHSGPCVAGVVGTKMPRYCLFGDTVNIASRMESGGFALRIHLSETTATLLQRIGGYNLECRGEREVKGKGIMKTYWLNGKDGFDMPLPDASMRAGEGDHEFK